MSKIQFFERNSQRPITLPAIEPVIWKVLLETQQIFDRSERIWSFSIFRFVQLTWHKCQIFIFIKKEIIKKYDIKINTIIFVS